MTQLAIVSTKDVAPSDKFGLWKDTLWQLMGRLRSEATGDESFAGKRGESQRLRALRRDRQHS